MMKENLEKVEAFEGLVWVVARHLMMMVMSRIRVGERRTFSLDYLDQHQHPRQLVDLMHIGPETIYVDLSQ